MGDGGDLNFHDEVELEDFEWDEEEQAWTYPCPCGDRFMITQDDLEYGEEVATCPSCSLIVRVIYDADSLPEPPSSEEVKTTAAVKKEAVKA